VPVAYITGRREFYGLEFVVTPDVLIPRVESEMLVKSVLDNTVKSSGTILDLGTGSGCLLISLLFNLKKYKGVGLDISYNALKIARQNAINLDIYDRCSFVCGDMTEVNFFIKNKFDVIVCNPPYISYDDDYENSILNEPKQALFTHEKGLFFYKKLLSKLNKLCKRDGIIFFEIGRGQKAELEYIYRNENISFLKDLSGNYRIMTWKN
jgi:release factor glutamine methyltransferase